MQRNVGNKFRQFGIANVEETDKSSFLERVAIPVPFKCHRWKAGLLLLCDLGPFAIQLLSHLRKSLSIENEETSSFIGKRLGSSSFLYISLRIQWETWPKLRLFTGRWRAKSITTTYRRLHLHLQLQPLSQEPPLFVGLFPFVLRPDEKCKS